jgi:hypothetical protein
VVFSGFIRQCVGVAGEPCLGTDLTCDIASFCPARHRSGRNTSPRYGIDAAVILHFYSSMSLANISLTGTATGVTCRYNGPHLPRRRGTLPLTASNSLRHTATRPAIGQSVQQPGRLVPELQHRAVSSCAAIGRATGPVSLGKHSPIICNGGSGAGKKHEACNLSSKIPPTICKAGHRLSCRRPSDNRRPHHDANTANLFTPT